MPGFPIDGLILVFVCSSVTTLYYRHMKCPDERGVLISEVLNREVLILLLCLGLSSTQKRSSIIATGDISP